MPWPHLQVGYNVLIYHMTLPGSIVFNWDEPSDKFRTRQSGHTMSTTDHGPPLYAMYSRFLGSSMDAAAYRKIETLIYSYYIASSAKLTVPLSNPSRERNHNGLA